MTIRLLKNKSSATLTKGTIVFIESDGIEPADASASISFPLAVIYDLDIPSGRFGLVRIFERSPIKLLVPANTTVNANTLVYVGSGANAGLGVLTPSDDARVIAVGYLAEGFDNSLNSNPTIALLEVEPIGGVGSLSSELLTIIDLRDIEAKTGSGRVVVMQDAPTINMPFINNFIHAQHDHETPEGGGLLDAAAIATGVFNPDRLGTGVRNGTKFLRDDGTWQAAAGVRPATIVVAASNSHDTTSADFVCTGTDDQNTINSAIAGLPTFGGRILLLEGTYNITGSIVINKSNVILQGQGWSTELKIPNGSTAIISNGIISIPANTSGIYIYNLQINGNMANNTAECIGVYANSPSGITISDCIIENLFIHDIRGMGIWLRQVSDSIIKTCRSVNFLSGVTVLGGFPIRLNNCLRCAVVDCTAGGNPSISGNNGASITSFGGRDISIINNRLLGGGDSGISVSSVKTLIFNNFIGSYIWAIITADDSVVVGNTIGNVIGSPNPIEGIRVTNSICSYNIIYASSVGIRTLGNSIISNNRIVGCHNGIFTSATTSNGHVIRDNDIYNCTKGIVIISSKNSIIGNSLKATGANSMDIGIEIQSFASDNLVINNDFVAGGGTYSTGAYADSGFNTKVNLDNSANNWNRLP